MAMKKKAPAKKAPAKKGDEPVRAGLKAKQGKIAGSAGPGQPGSAKDALSTAYKQGKKDFGFRSGGKNRNPVKNFEIVSGVGMYARGAKDRPQRGSAGAKKR